ncbi:MAG TPA: Ger(x)C family spore germination protein [Firmicutes bacterium]|nr:Ger(x)C family spore germination protein [Bacillota bacterium]
MNWRKKVIFLFMVFILPGLVFYPAGCWDRREPNILGIVTVAAFDIDEESGLFKVYAQMDNPLGGAEQQSGNSSGGGGGRSPSWFIESHGHTIYEAIINMEHVSTRRLFWSHVKAVLFSEKLARKGIRPVLDFLDRERQIRLTAKPFIVEGDLRQLLIAEFPLELEGGEAIEKHSFSVKRETSTLSEVDSLLILFRDISTPGKEVNMPRIKVLASEEKESKKEPAGMTNPARISGIGIFHGDKFIGFLDKRETAGYNWLTGNMQRHNLVLKCPVHEDGYLTVEVFESSAKLTPEFKDNEVRFKATVFAGGRLQDFDSPLLPLGEDFVNSLNRRMATAIRNEIMCSLEKARKLNSDIFGFGRTIYRTKYRKWQQLENDWQNIFPNIMVDIEINARVHRHGIVLQPIEIK